MAERRMFAKTIIDSDAFLDMPISARLLYYDLSMRADDDGFNNAPKKVMRTIGATTDDMNILIARKFVLPFESGVVVIKHWKIHNYIAKDRYKETKYKEEKSQLMLDENNAYTSCIQPVYECETQVRLGKDRLSKDSIDILPSPPKATKTSRHKYGLYKNVLLSDEELEKLKTEFSDWEERIERLSEYIESSGKRYKSHLATIRAWARKDTKEEKKTNKQAFRGSQDMSDVYGDELIL
jgi:Asp-tRNA(Asn)/Glu-tRNA(Gln) amidotransferase C subunit